AGVGAKGEKVFRRGRIEHFTQYALMICVMAGFFEINNDRHALPLPVPDGTFCNDGGRYVVFICAPYFGYSKSLQCGSVFSFVDTLFVGKSVKDYAKDRNFSTI